MVEVEAYERCISIHFAVLADMADVRDALFHIPISPLPPGDCECHCAIGARRNVTRLFPPITLCQHPEGGHGAHLHSRGPGGRSCGSSVSPWEIWASIPDDKSRLRLLIRAEGAAHPCRTGESTSRETEMVVSHGGTFICSLPTVPNQSQHSHGCILSLILLPIIS